MLQAVQGIQACLVDFAQLSLVDQIQLVAAETDLLVGIAPQLDFQQGSCRDNKEANKGRVACGEGEGGRGAERTIGPPCVAVVICLKPHLSPL